MQSSRDTQFFFHFKAIISKWEIEGMLLHTLNKLRYARVSFFSSTFFNWSSQRTSSKSFRYNSRRNWERKLKRFMHFLNLNCFKYTPAKNFKTVETGTNLNISTEIIHIYRKYTEIHETLANQIPGQIVLWNGLRHNCVSDVEAVK